MLPAGLNTHTRQERGAILGRMNQGIQKKQKLMKSGRLFRVQISPVEAMCRFDAGDSLHLLTMQTGQFKQFNDVIFVLRP